VAGSSPPHLPFDNEIVEEPSDPFGSIRGQSNRTKDVVHPDRCPADAFVEDVGEVRLDRRPEDCERSLALEWRRGPVDRLKAGSDCELGQVLTDGQVVGDQLVDRDIECVKYPLRGQIQRDDLSIDAPDTSTDLERAHPIVEEVAKQLSPSSAFRAGAIPCRHAARTVIPALRQRWIGDPCGRVSRIALVPDTERAR
jgi:hypothetical protein